MTTQPSLFSADDNIKSIYTKRVKSLVYTPSNKKPNVLELYSRTKTTNLIKRIKQANITDDEKVFLIEAAKRHTMFNYTKIADYYAHSNKEMQELMEQSALVIVDFDKAIENGFIQLDYNIRQSFLQHTNET